jgi:hypothetical protein
MSGFDISAIDTRIFVGAIWGVGGFLIYGRLLWKGWRRWQLHRDWRSRRELYSDIAYFIVAVAAGLAITLAIFGDRGADGRLKNGGLITLMTTMAFGAWWGAGIVRLRDAPHEDLGDTQTDDTHSG